jgi:hypothetical protein
MEKKRVKLRNASDNVVDDIYYERMPLIVDIEGLLRYRSAAKKPQLGFAGPIFCPGIINLDVVDCPIASTQVEGPCAATGVYPVPELKHLITPVFVMYDHAVECYGRSFDSDLKRTKPSIGTPNLDTVVITRSVDVGFTQIYPRAAVPAVPISLSVDVIIKTCKQHTG